MSVARPTLSQRASTRIGNTVPPKYVPPAGPYYDPDLFPDGVINLSTAENTLLSPRLLKYLSAPLVELRTQHLRYRSTLTKSGLPTVEDLLPDYVNTFFRPRQPIMRVNSVAGPGIGACFAQLIWALVGEGEGILMTTPFYDDYVRDIVHPSAAVLVLANIPPSTDPLSTDALPILEAKIVESQAAGAPIRVLLTPNPQNPIPQVVPQKLIEGYALLAEKYNLHLIVDEVFGLSTFGPSAYTPANDEPFKSILSYDLPALGVDPARVHVLAGPTKDFGASGLKLGLIISPGNQELIDVLRPLFNATPISSASDVLFTRVLQDKAFVETFLADNRAALRAAYELVAQWSTHHGLKFTRANAGVYILVDLAPFIERLNFPPNTSLDKKLQSTVSTLSQHKVFLKPTTSGADPIPTRFRLVYSSPKETMLLALARIEAAFGIEKK